MPYVVEEDEDRAVALADQFSEQLGLLRGVQEQLTSLSMDRDFPCTQNWRDTQHKALNEELRALRRVLGRLRPDDT